MPKGFTVWFTGLSGSGKTTISSRVAEIIMKTGRNVEILDGDVVRTNLSKGLGFSKEDRDTNIRRIAFVCELLCRNGAAVAAAAISPYRAIRLEAREKIKNFVEVFCTAPLEVLIQRDTKGLYKKALAGELKNFTGVSDPYEPPENPEVVIHSDLEPVEAAAGKVIRKIVELGYLEPEVLDYINDSPYTQEEEAAIKKRLEDLGYM